MKKSSRNFTQNFSQRWTDICGFCGKKGIVKYADYTTVIGGWDYKNSEIGFCLCLNCLGFSFLQEYENSLFMMNDMSTSEYLNRFGDKNLFHYYEEK